MGRRDAGQLMVIWAVVVVASKSEVCTSMANVHSPGRREQHGACLVGQRVGRGQRDRQRTELLRRQRRGQGDPLRSGTAAQQDTDFHGAGPGAGHGYRDTAAGANTDVAEADATGAANLNMCDCIIWWWW